jgi:hypothetical protein
MPKDSGFPPMFPSLPVYLIFELSPLPSQGAMLSELLTDLFRDVGGANGDTQFCFYYTEVTDAA